MRADLARPPVDRAEWLRPWPRLTRRRAATAAALAIVYSWSFLGAQISSTELVKGLPQILDFLRRLLPPEWKTIATPIATPPVVLPFGFTLMPIGWPENTVPIPEIVFAIVETVQMALVGTTVAVLMSLPIGFLAARNMSPHRWIYQSTRLALNVVRAVPEIIWALVFVAAVGLGPFSGVLGLAIGGTGYLGKLFAEAIEAVDPQQVLAVEATGASRAQTIVFGVIPQALPVVASVSLLIFEANVRTATILGIVGAGGVGFVLNKYMALFQYHYLLGALILLVIVVTALDRASDAIRKRLT
jgi:phosphonate transport system permease protein